MMSEDLHQFKKANTKLDKNMETYFVGAYFNHAKSLANFQNKFQRYLFTMQTVILDEPDLLPTVSSLIESFYVQDMINLDVKNLSGIAIMTDTDNSKLMAVSYYQNIYFSSN